MSVRTIIARFTKRFARNKRGAAAVEFALVALPFFWLMVALAEVTLIGFAQTSLDYSLTEVGRRIRTGEVQTQGLTRTQLTTNVCNSMARFLTINCSNLVLDVDSYAGFVNVTNPDPRNPDGTLDQSQFNFSPGTESSIVLVRAFYRWRVITPMFQQFLANAGDQDRLISSSMLFRNEPFTTP